MVQTSPRGPILTTLAVLMGLLAISNFSKPLTQALALDETAGFVFFGMRLHGVANAVMGPLFGLLLAVYAYGAWTMRRWVVPLAVAYAIYVPVNLILFARQAPADETGSAVFMIAYTVVAIGVSGGGALYLLLNRHRLS